MIGKRRLTLVAGPIAMAVLVASAAWVLWSGFERSKQASQSVEHTYRVLIASERFLSTVREAESSLRAYFIRRDPSELANFHTAATRHAQILDDLEKLTQDNAQQQEALKVIRELAAQRLAVLANVEKGIGDGSLKLPTVPGTRGKGAEIMEQLTSKVYAFEEEERRLLAWRNGAAAEAESWTRFMLVLTSTMLAVVLLFAGSAIERYVRNREAVHQVLQRQADLIDFSHDAIVTLDPGGAITGWNAGAMEVYGWTSAEAVGRQAHEMLGTGDKEVLAKITEALSTTGRWDGELAQTTKDGRKRIVESRYVRNRGGEAVGILNISRDATQRKEAEDLMRQVAEQRRLALDAAQLGSWDYDVGKDTVVWDERCRDMMGLPGLGPASFEQALKLVHPEERELMRGRARATMAESDDGRFSHDFRIQSRDGAVRWITTYGRVYFAEKNGARQALRVIGVNRDITESKQVQEALRDSEDKVRVALETGRIGIFSDLVDGNKILFDERARELLGFEGTGVLDAEEFFRHVHPEDREKMRKVRERDLGSPDVAPGEMDYRIVQRNGEIRWLVARRRVYFSGEGETRRAQRVLGVLLDITKQKQAEQRLTEALAQSDQERRRLGVILETLPAGVVLTDRDNKFVDGNAKAVQIWRAGDFLNLARRSDEQRGWRADTGERLRLPDWPHTRALSGETVPGEIIDIERFDDSKGTLFNAASPIKDQRGAIHGAVSVMVDITEQRQIELALRHSEESLRTAHHDLERLLEQKNILFQEVQHRVKNNLQVVSSLLSLEAQRFDDSAFHDALNESRDRIRSMALMHEKFYHLDDLARIDFSDYVDELARYFFSSYMANPAAIEFSSNVDAKLNMGQAMPCGLILQELLSNSVKHAFPDGHGKIQIDFHSEDGKFRLSYWDSGVGLPANVDLQNPGTLGLQLVSDLAAQLLGKIQYEYRQGAQFTLTFG